MHLIVHVSKYDLQHVRNNTHRSDGAATGLNPRNMLSFSRSSTTLTLSTRSLLESRFFDLPSLLETRFFLPYSSNQWWLVLTFFSCKTRNNNKSRRKKKKKNLAEDNQSHSIYKPIFHIFRDKNRLSLHLSQHFYIDGHTF